MNCKTFVDQSPLQIPAKLLLINKTASHVPNKSLCKAPAALMPVSL
jgi:hypothetical protein